MTKESNTPERRPVFRDCGDISDEPMVEIGNDDQLPQRFYQGEEVERIDFAPAEVVPEPHKSLRTRLRNFGRTVLKR